MANDTWRTPPEVFDYFDQEYNFKVDCCASFDNALCSDYFDQEIDFLTYDLSVIADPGEWVWCNPPYSKPLPFVQKCISNAELHGIGCVLLLNSDFSTRWGELLAQYECKHIVFTGSRMAFLNDDGVPIKGNNRPQIAFVIPPFVRPGTPTVEYLPLKRIM